MEGAQEKDKNLTWVKGERDPEELDDTSRKILAAQPQSGTSIFDPVLEDAGALLYNEAVLITAVGSLPIRCGRPFESGRKLGKTHQNVVIFCKGDPKLATKACGPVEFGEIQDIEETGSTMTSALQ